MTNDVSPALQRSTFVTTLAWVFILLAGFATAISTVQNIMITVMFPAAEISNAAAQAQNDTTTPQFAKFMFQNVRLFFFAFFLVCITALTAAVGLLKRKNWARVLFIALMVGGILWCFGGVLMSIAMLSSMPLVEPNAPQAAREQFALMSKVIIGFNFVVAIGVTILFGWIIKRLRSREIRLEFSATSFSQ